MMDDAPRTLDELKSWLKRTGADPARYVLEGEPAYGSYFVRHVPPYWTMHHYDSPRESVMVRCDSEADLCECFVEVVKGTASEPQSKTQLIRQEVGRRIEKSWQDLFDSLDRN